MLRAYADETRLSALAARADLSPRQARRLVRGHLAGLVASRRAWAQWLLSAATRPLVRRVQRIDADRTSLCRLRRLSERGPLVFLPAHRSYADSLVLGAALRDAGIARPWRLAGANLSFWPLGPLARRSATVFIRRDFGRDPSYHVAVRCYLAALLGGARNVEWYPEAGRSRTGRLRRLRHGMLRVLVGAYLDSGIDDAHAVPVSIVYDTSPDTEAVTEEDAGVAAKRPEGLRTLIRYLRAGRAAGPRTARLAFAEPVSLREVTRTAPNEWAAARALARRVAAGLRDATPVTPEALLALALAADGGGPQPEARLTEQVGALLDYAAARRLPVDRPESIGAALDRMVAAGVVAWGPVGYSIAAGRHRIAAYHRNVAEHWFMPRAAAELVTAGAATADRLRELLAPLDPAAASDVFEWRLAAELRALGDGLEREPFLLAPRLLGPVFEAYREVALSPAEADSARSTHSAHGTETAHWPESRSAELSCAARAVLAAERLLGPQADGAARADFAAEMSRLLTRLRQLVETDARRTAGTADVRH